MSNTDFTVEPPPVPIEHRLKFATNGLRFTIFATSNILLEEASSGGYIPNVYGNFYKICAEITNGNDLKSKRLRTESKIFDINHQKVNDVWHEEVNKIVKFATEFFETLSKPIAEFPTKAEIL